MLRCEHKLLLYFNVLHSVRAIWRKTFAQPYSWSILRTTYKLYAGRFESGFDVHHSGQASTWNTIKLFQTRDRLRSNARVSRKDDNGPT